MRRFGTQGRVSADKHYVVPRTAEIADFLQRVREGKYIVLFAPRQTGKTTFFRLALSALITEDATYLPIQLDFQAMRNVSPTTFYEELYYRIHEQIEAVFERQGVLPSEALTRFLENTPLTDHLSMIRFFKQLQRNLQAHVANDNFLENGSRKQETTFKRVVLLIDEFDGIPPTVVSDFLYALRQIYLSDEMRCPYCVGIVGVRSIAQLDYDRSVSPFNIQDEFKLPNFTAEQVDAMFSQYTAEVGQTFAPEAIQALYKQTAGQPFLVNRIAQILTEELDIPKTETITLSHFAMAHALLLEEDNTNFTHLITNIRRDRRFENVLMEILNSDEGLRFNLRNPLINELATYGVITKGADNLCEIVNPIYLYCIIQAFKPAVNGLERDYFPEGHLTGFRAYLTPTGDVAMEALLDNFRDFIARAGYKILEVPETPQEYVGQHLLFSYLELFVGIVGGGLFLEVQTGRGKIDLLISHNQRKYIVETKIWRGLVHYEAGKKQLAAYVKTEGAIEGYYVVFDHRRDPESRIETETIDGISIRSYVIPVAQEQPSSVC